ncbi:bifunctional [glutamate--ammonia ligase]-adenylyl-L-tyrosine phosphorylase/[glutamate--ammonia-ligase] adenylyltransferase [Robbsia sp. KACC 23696]|uniref:bifunctional [glutamate--ammonia ligase]-adenylyl-L-tyrosine phosphorylase/[glutamate--ammonia-ligase] adenylyltransferase n=1 Tax=Robbsia sp. KACC 23696 TaxID=3149231 RepID=UPI00325B1206
MARPDVAGYVDAQGAQPLTRESIVARHACRRDEAEAEIRATHTLRADAVLDDDQRHDALCTALRRLRADIFCTVMARDLAGLADVAEVTGAMSDLAEVVVAEALDTIQSAMIRRFGTPTAESDGAPLTLGVVGMGKLGGRELNVSSDIDLIFVYEEEGQTTGGERAGIDNHDFFTRVGRKLIGALSERTADDYVFRVDMRLRPNGDSGPLVCSMAMLEAYFFVQGREWERYAWIKGRLLPCVDQSVVRDAQARLAVQLDQLVRPFVYRRYLDFGVIDAIRSLHRQIGEEARRRALLRPDLSDDVKLGRGGIREIEFGAQVFQLVRGGQDPALRLRPTLQVLAIAAQRGLIGDANVDALRAAYDFLRRIEHRLQYAEDAQTHAMPVEASRRVALAAAMGYADAQGIGDYAALQAALAGHRDVVEREFEQVFAPQDAPPAGTLPTGASADGPALRVGGDAPAALSAVPPSHAVDDAAAALWHETSAEGGSDGPQGRAALRQYAVSLGLIDSDDAEKGGEARAEATSKRPGADDVALDELVARMRAMHTASRYQQLPSESRERVDALVRRALVELSASASAASRDAAAAGESGPSARRLVFVRWLDLLERICGRRAYLALLTEFPAALRRVLDVLAGAQWAASYLIKHPQLLDELLDDRTVHAPFDWPAFARDLREKLRGTAKAAGVGGARVQAAPDVEQQMDLLRHAQHAETFRILLRDLYGVLSVEAVSDRLSELADTILDVTLETVWRAIAERPMLDGDLPRFAIIAYGKLGGKELGYGSDLDLIFLYDDQREGDDVAEHYTRLARRLISWLTTATGAGQLYDVDLRLRPNGSSGLLVTPIDGFRRYQQRAAGQANTAWVWEHQAITRARYCAGDPAIGATFEAIRTEVLATPRDGQALAAEIVAMRDRVHDGHPNHSGLFDLKHDRGGMVDIEFLVQYGVLLHAAHHPALIRNSGNLALLDVLAGLGFAPIDDIHAVQAAYRRYRILQHRVRLDGATHARVASPRVEAERQAVRRLWDHVFGNTTPALDPTLSGDPMG